MDQLRTCCTNAGNFPMKESLLDPNTAEDTLNALSLRLNERDKVLFQENEDDAKYQQLRFWETGEATTDPNQLAWRSTCIATFDALERHLCIYSVTRTRDPLCRFVFLCGPNSRARLFTSMRILMLSLTYLQALPEFLDFIFPFGLQQYPHDPYFSEFRSDDRVSDAARGVSIDELGRSGRDIRLCYSLKSVERTAPHSPEKWSIRQTSIYHSFDIQSGYAVWIVIKGDDLIRNRLQKATSSHDYVKNMNSGSVDRMFSSVFAVHRLICDWAGENWRWYLNHIEERVQVETRHASAVLGTDSDLEPSPRSLLRAATFEEDQLQSTQSSGQVSNQPLAVPPPTVSSTARPRCPDGAPKPTATDVFSLKHIQNCQYAQDQAGQALLVLESNANVIAEMRNYYRSVTSSEDWPESLKETCASDVARFDKSAGTAESHTRLQCLRAQTLRTMVADRKAILHGIMEARRQSQAQQSAKNMEAMSQRIELITADMHEIAQKTQRETVSMRIITLVTLFFLPGTFIAGFMNTTILQWNNGKSSLDLPALWFFLYTVGPMTIVVFFLWFLFSWWIKREEKNVREKKKLSGETSLTQKGV